jgi:hypothetical protein
MKKTLLCTLFLAILLPTLVIARDCPLGMVFSKSATYQAGDCIPAPGQEVRLDISQGITRMGASTEAYMVPSSYISPLYVASGYLKLWLDASDPNNDGAMPVDGTALSAWKDKSGNGFNITQSTGANQPVFVKSPTVGGEPFNRPIIRFDGINDVMVTSTTFMPLFTNAITVFIVSNVTTVQANSILSANNFTISLPNISNQIAWTMGAASVSPAWNAGANAYYVWTFKASPAEMAIYRNHGDIRISDPQTPLIASSTALSIGGSYKGDIAEILIYNTTLSDDEREFVEKYLNRKYGLYDET